MSAPCPCRPRPKRGRPRTADNAVWELEIAAVEFREMFEKVGPSLRALSRCPDHRRETSALASALARHQRQAFHRRA